jgi:hypothetical protein
MKSVEMRGVLKDWKASGLSLHAFGKREGVGYAKLIYWRRKFDERREPKTEERFAPVRVVPDAAPEPGSSDPVNVWLPNGVSFEVPPGLCSSDLERIVRVLSSC